MSEAPTSPIPGETRTDSHAQAGDPGGAHASSDEAATLSYDAFEHTNSSPDAATHSAQGSITRSIPSVLSGSLDSRERVRTQPLAVGAILTHNSDHTSQGSTLTLTSKEYYSSSDISQRSQASILHDGTTYHSPLERFSLRRSLPLQNRLELVPERTHSWSDHEQSTSNTTRALPADDFWSTRAQDSSSDVSPIAATRLFGREVSNISSFSTHSHTSEGSATVEHSAQEPDTSPAGIEQINPGRHIIHSSQGSHAQETPEGESRREDIPHTPTPRRSRSIYVESTFLEELTPERLRSGKVTDWHPSPSERASQRAAERQLQTKSKPSPIAHTSTSAVHTRQSLVKPPRTRHHPTKARTWSGHNILFASKDNASLKRSGTLVDQLGGAVVTGWRECTHLVTDQVRNTVRCLCAIASGKLVVSLSWISKCREEGRFVDETPYLLKPITAQPPFSGKRLFLSQKMPIKHADFREIVTAGNGKVLTREPDVFLEDVIIIGDPKASDEQHKRLRSLNYTIISKAAFISSITH